MLEPESTYPRNINQQQCPKPISCCPRKLQIDTSSAKSSARAPMESSIKPSIQRNFYYCVGIVQTGQTVAIKKIRLGKYKEGVNFTALREIKLLKELKDPNIIELIDAFPHKGNLHLVFEFMESDLEAVIRDRNIVLSPADIKSYLQMTLKGLAHCHKKWVLHRDMKPNNLLIGADGQLKLADFGLARIFGSPDRKFTHQVFARWYRAPELLFGTKQYGAGVDVWAAACIFAELLLRRPFLQVFLDSSWSLLIFVTNSCKILVAVDHFKLLHQ
ncbi:hypothetical protein HHK36_006862 [Tetracentron sinense]|uniref:[RNA-polymerase]-subunit kinase n=1 Tax=Tetracentron sinense TaxID=13715 RepID=A0A834ZM99_TETSI|nr:hypothetical protein HHK36_006858 [Tetracentron sinense]KAF8407727.1 hypothetical protein HHK36_006862 [Tetracentron sinense]